MEGEADAEDDDEEECFSHAISVDFPSNKN
jgi:hypothetical protein